jgi:hypothetical protein
MVETSTRITVPVAEVAVEAYRSVVGRLGLLFDLAWLPLIVMLAATLLPGYLHFYLGWRALPSWTNGAFELRAEDVLGAVTSLVALTAFAVRWHQAMLFAGERQPPVATFLGAWLRFILYAVLLYLVSAALLATLYIAENESAPAYIPPVAALLAMALWVGVLRCLLIFPAAAYGKPLGLVAAWRAMRGNSWRFMACSFLACAPLTILVIVVLSSLVRALHLDEDSTRIPLGFFILRGLIGVGTDVIVIALGASVLSAFYRRIVLRGLGSF